MIIGKVINMEISAHIISYTLAQPHMTADLQTSKTLNSVVSTEKSYKISFIIEVQTEFSKAKIWKTCDDFYNFHSQLCYFSHAPCQEGRLIDIIPKFPLKRNMSTFTNHSSAVILLATLENYLQSLTYILSNHYFNKFDPWVRLILSFLEVNSIKSREEKSAKLITKIFKSLTRNK
ncbi:unnamed protein product [Blepharisma stoltei]|uniref:PX domain-containing protein n=1 Tax=Blepharisma stoltei TaxID=1481888 RepID=A0AAU9J6D6_9CILI|nr:unnamed protein product [Blepharisma stoltei]